MTGFGTGVVPNLGATTTYVNTNTLTFSNFGTLTAGNGTGDTFNITANLTLNLNAGNGA